MTLFSTVYIIKCDLKEALCMKTFSKHRLAGMLKLVAPGVGVLALVAFASIIIYEGTKVTVNVQTDHSKKTIQTHADTVGDLLEELGITVNEHDEVSPSLDQPLENKMEIHHKKAKQLYVTIDEEKQRFFTTKETVGEFLKENHLSFNEHDILSFEEKDPIEENLELSVTKAFQVTLNDGGKRSKIWSTGEKVSELLEKNNITLSKLDQIEPTLEREVDRKTDIEITRIEKEKEVVEEPIDFKTVRKEDHSLEKGKEKVLAEGKKGILQKTIEIIKENGEEADRIVKEKVKEEAKDRVVAVGTKVPPPPPKPKEELVTVAANKSDQPEGKTLYVEATAYTADCKDCSGITATGINLNKNRNAKVISVDPNVIPLGTKVWVEGYGEAVAGDVGGAIKGNRIDLHMPTQADAYRYGRKQNVKIVILE